MTDDSPLIFSAENCLGTVSSVDTTRVLVLVQNSTLLPRAAVGSLVAIQGMTAQEFLIGMTERVTRQVREQVSAGDPLDPTTISTEVVPDDSIRVILLGTYRTKVGTDRNRFKRGADSFPQIDRECYLVEGPNLQKFMGLLGKELEPSQRLELGKFVIDGSAVAIANGDRFFQRHAAILGSTGSGKSYAVSLILERAAARQFANIIVLDMHGEYSSLANPPADAEGNPRKPIATYYKIAGPGDLDKPSNEALFLPYWLLNRDEMLSMMRDGSEQSAPNQAARFTYHVRELKDLSLQHAKQESTRKTFTVDSPIPYALRDLIQRLVDDDTGTKIGKKGDPITGDWKGKLTKFIARIESKRDDRRYGFMFQPPESALAYEWLAVQARKLLAPGTSSHGIKIVDFSEVPSDILPVVTGVFARLLYDVQFWMSQDSRTPFVFVCDEAHLYLPTKEGADAVERQALYSFERIAKEGRKYGVSLLVVSQRPSDVSKTILSQCNNFLVLRLTNDQDQGVVRKLMPDSLAGIMDGLPMLDTGEAVLLGDAVLLPARIRLNYPAIEPLSQTRNFWQEWGSKSPDSDAVEKAIETLRRQSRVG
jgi:DNA helicase HerA-like ATPase